MSFGSNFSCQCQFKLHEFNIYMTCVLTRNYKPDKATQRASLHCKMFPEHAWCLFEITSLMCRMKTFRKLSGRRFLLCASMLRPGLLPCSACWVPLRIRALYRLRDALLEPSEEKLPGVELLANHLQILRPTALPQCSQTGLQYIVQNVIVRICKNR